MAAPAGGLSLSVIIGAPADYRDDVAADGESGWISRRGRFSLHWARVVDARILLSVRIRVHCSGFSIEQVIAIKEAT
jgi:hypothetical protein